MQCAEDEAPVKEEYFDDLECADTSGTRMNVVESDFGFDDGSDGDNGEADKGVDDEDGDSKQGDDAEDVVDEEEGFAYEEGDE